MTVAGVMARLLFRPAGRFRLWLLLMSLVTLCLSGALLLGAALEDAACRGGLRLGAELLVMPQEGESLPPESPLLGVTSSRSLLPEGIEAALSSLPGIVSAVPRYLSETAADACCESGELLLVGFDPSRDQELLSWQPPGEGGESGAILAGWKLLKAPGATIFLHGHPFRLGGRLEQSGNRRFDAAVFIPLEGLRNMERSSRQEGATPFAVVWGRPSLILLRLAATVSPAMISRTLEERFPGIRVIPAPLSVRGERQRLERLAGSGAALPFLAWPLALAVTALLLGLFWRERRRNLGLMIALGWGRGMIFLLAGIEALLFSIFSLVIGTAGAWGLLRLLAADLGAAVGVPLLPGAVATALPGMLLIWPFFAGGVVVEGLLIVCFLLRQEPAELLGAPCG